MSEFELRWFVPKSVNGTKPILQYRTFGEVFSYDEILKRNINRKEWSVWKNVPVIHEE